MRVSYQTSPTLNIRKRPLVRFASGFYQDAFPELFALGSPNTGSRAQHQRHLYRVGTGFSPR